LSLREHEVEDDEGLDGVVEGEPVEDDIDKGLGKGESTKDDPVGQPLNIILRLRRLQSSHREVSWGSETEREDGWVEGQSSDRL